MGDDKKEEEEEEDDRRREAAIASTVAFRPNFKPKVVTQTQLSKFQELHRKRLQIKSKSKCEKKPKAGTGKSHPKHKNARDSVNQDSSITVDSSGCSDRSSSSVIQQEKEEEEEAPKKRKLHWGLDTKERWERKANM